MDPAPRRIKVSVHTRVLTPRGESPVQLVALSSTSALLHHTSEVGEVGALGETLELFLPSVGPEVRVMAGIEQSLRVKEGHVLTVQFMVVDRAVQKALDDLLGLLLAGDGGGRRKHPRISYGIPILYGEQAQHAADLEEISLGGLGMRVGERMLPGSQLKITIPDRTGHSDVSLRGSVVTERPSETHPGQFSIGVDFAAMTPDIRIALGTLLSDLLRK